MNFFRKKGASPSDQDEYEKAEEEWKRKLAEFETEQNEKKKMYHRARVKYREEKERYQQEKKHYDIWQDIFQGLIQQGRSIQAADHVATEATNYILSKEPKPVQISKPLIPRYYDEEEKWSRKNPRPKLEDFSED